MVFKQPENGGRLVKKVLVTGANGMLGQDLCPMFSNAGFEVIKTDVDTLDITNQEQVNQVINESKADFVIHCAAYTNVDKAEEDFETAKLINATGSENLALACEKNNVTMIYISTDYVFDGEKTEAYLPTDDTNPINNYGLTKLMGEVAVQEICTKYYIARTSWLYGHYGKNFVETMISLKDNLNLKVVDDQVGCPTWTRDLVSGILALIQEEKEYGVYHLCGGGSTSWYGFAKEVGVNPKPCATDEFPRPAKRPMNSIMDNGGSLRDWKLALKDYMDLREEVLG